MIQLPDLFEHGFITDYKPRATDLIIAVEAPAYYLIKRQDRYIVIKQGMVLEEEDEARVVEPKGTVYVAGPMRGIFKHNFPAFDAAARKLKDMGYYVFNPADFDRADGLDESTSDEDVTDGVLRRCLRRDTDAITKSTHIALLPGWENSSGARSECVLGHALGCSFIDMTSGKAMCGFYVCAVIGSKLVDKYQARLVATALSN